MHRGFISQEFTRIQFLLMFCKHKHTIHINLALSYVAYQFYDKMTNARFTDHDNSKWEI